MLWSIIVWLAVGALAGFLAGKIMKGSGSGIVMNIVIGIIGSLIGGWVFGLLGINMNGLLGSLITAIIGASLLLWIVSLVTKKK